MKYLIISFYVLALLVQIGTVFQCFSSFKHVGKIRSGWIVLAAAFTVVLVHRLFEIGSIRGDHIAHVIDSFFSFIVSSLFFAGIILIRRSIDNQLRTNEELEILNQYDNLTHALSRAETLKRIEIEIERSERFNHPLAVLEIDIDHFKHVNDTYGHQVGDEILRSLTQCCLNVLRTNDSFGRVGGEEFVIILPETSQSHAIEAGERLRKAVECTTHNTSAKDPLRITISVGVACFEPEKNKQNDRYLLIHELMKHADQAMYQAKDSGRNRTVLWTAPIVISETQTF